MNEKYDIIGDIHGHAKPLRALLEKLNYREAEGHYSHPERKVIFLGDFIDRGPAIREVLQIVRSMTDAGRALAVMGNHEINALAYHTSDGKGGYLRPHDDDKTTQHQATLDQIANPAPDEWTGWLDWFRTLPFFLDLGDLRVVHAAWDDSAVALVRNLGPVTPEKMAVLVDKRTALGRAKQILLHGLEIDLPVERRFIDKHGHNRKDIRTRWWMDIRGMTYREAVFPDCDEIPSLPIPIELVPTHRRAYPADAPPVFNGHYWVPDTTFPTLQAPNIACLDYSVAKDGMLVAYRWDGEATLDADKLVSVENPSLPRPLRRGYRVMVDDNFHYMDETERRGVGEFATYGEALAAAKKMVEDFFTTRSLDQTAEELYDDYTSFGDDPFIASFGGTPEPPIRFSAWGYAQEVSHRLAQDPSK